MIWFGMLKMAMGPWFLFSGCTIFKKRFNSKTSCATHELSNEAYTEGFKLENEQEIDNIFTKGELNYPKEGE